MYNPNAIDDLLAIGAGLSPANRRALLYPIAAQSTTVRLWLRWVDLFTPTFVVAMLLLLAGMFATLAGASPTIAVLIVQSGTAPLALLTIKMWRIGWQVLLIAAAQSAPEPDG